MKSLIVGDKPTVERLAERLKSAASHSEFQRIQCVLMRATLGSSAAQIAQLLGWSTATVLRHAEQGRRVRAHQRHRRP
jgi:DNA-directed RNA polymerase specialized sigma24 family protein